MLLLADRSLSVFVQNLLFLAASYVIHQCGSKLIVDFLLEDIDWHFLD